MFRYIQSVIVTIIRAIITLALLGGGISALKDIKSKAYESKKRGMISLYDLNRSLVGETK